MVHGSKGAVHETWNCASARDAIITVTKAKGVTITDAAMMTVTTLNDSATTGEFSWSTVHLFCFS